MFFIESYYHLTLANYIQIKEQRLIIKERMSGYIYCKIYYGIWVPDFALDGQKAIISNTIFRRWCWLGFCCELRRWIRQELAQNEFDIIVDTLYSRIRKGWCWRHRVQNGYRFLCLYLFNISKCNITALCRKNIILPLYLPLIYSVKMVDNK